MSKIRISRSVFEQSIDRINRTYAAGIARDRVIASLGDAFEVYDDATDTARTTPMRDAGERFDRAAAIRERATALIASGQSVEAAEYNAARAVAYERGEQQPTKPLEEMSITELNELFASFSPSVLGIEDDHDEPMSDEDFAAGWSALGGDMAGATAGVGVDIAKAWEVTAAREAERAGKPAPEPVRDPDLDAIKDVTWADLGLKGRD
jgi:hypothetical protein